MADIGNLTVKVGAEVDEVSRAFDLLMKDVDALNRKTASVSTESGKSFDGLVNKISSVGATMTKLGAAIGIPLAAIAGSATKTAIDFESSFAGVKKTVDATEEEFKTLETQIRDMAKEMPIAVNDLNKIGEIGGQLGIAKESLNSFIEVIAKMETTTNLSADAAANAFSRMASQMKLTEEDFERMGSSIVALGNKGESTESDITNMANRLVGAMKTVGASATDVLGMAAALANVGVNAEAGGTAFSKLFGDMAKSVESGNAKLQGFADVAGMTTDEFSSAFKTNATDAVVAFIKGLGQMQESGGPVFQTLHDLGMRTSQLRNAILLTSGAYEDTAKAVDLSRSAWQENTALQEEAEKRFGTTKSAITVFNNKLNDVKLTLGEAFLPMLNKAIDAVTPFVNALANLAKGFSELDPNIQTMIGGFAGIFAVAGPALMSIAGLVRAAQTLAPIIAAISAPAAATAAAIIGLAAAAYIVYSNWDEIKDFLSKVWGNIRDSVLGKIEQIKGAFIVAWTGMKVQVMQIMNDLLNGIKTALASRLQPILDSVKNLTTGVTDAFRFMYEAVVGHSYVPDMVTSIGAHMNQLPMVMGPPTDAATQHVANSFGSLRATISTAGNGIKSEVMSIAAVTGDTFASMAVLIGQTTQQGMANVMTAFLMGKQNIGQMLLSLLERVINILFETALATMGIGKLISQALQAMWIPGAGTAIIVGLMAALFAVKAAMFGKLGKLAEGGLVMGPMVAQIGEAGPEAVVPLSGQRGRKALASLGGGEGGGEMTIIVEMNGREMARRVLEYMPGIVRMQGVPL